MNKYFKFILLVSFTSLNVEYGSSSDDQEDKMISTFQTPDIENLDVQNSLKEYPLDFVTSLKSIDPHFLKFPGFIDYCFRNFENAKTPFHLKDEIEKLPKEEWQNLKNANAHTVSLSPEVKIDTAEAYGLGKSLHGTKIQKVTINDGQIDSDGAVAFIESLQGSQVSVVDLSYNSIGDDRADDLGRAFHGTQVNTIKLFSCDIRVDGAINFLKALRGSLVQAVDLSYNPIGINEQLDPQQILEAKNNPKHILLKGSKARTLGHALCKNQIHTIELNRCGMGASGIINFLKALKKSSLDTLGLEGNGINNTKLSALGKNLKKTQIYTISLNDHTIDLNALRDFLEAWQGLEVRNVNFMFWHQFTSEEKINSLKSDYPTINFI
ncbi:MAG: hypothetical protein ACRYGR_09170 [Janthinobacterium lividum]